MHARAYIERNTLPFQLQVFVDMAARHPDRIQTESECPLCTSIIIGVTSLEKHLGRHLEGLALFALPHPESVSIEASKSDDFDDSESPAIQDESTDIDISIGKTSTLTPLRFLIRASFYRYRRFR